MKNIFLSVIITASSFLFLPGISAAQDTRVIDSLTKALATTKDSARVNILNTLSYKLYAIEPEKAMTLAHQALDESKKINYLIGIARAYNNMGVNYNQAGRLDKSIEAYMSAMEMMERANLPQQVAYLKGNIGGVYFSQGNYDKALYYMERCVAMLDSLNRKDEAAVKLINLGAAYGRLKKYDEAQKAYNRALATFAAKNDKSNMANCYINMGTLIQKREGKGRNALPYYLKAEQLSKELDDLENIMISQLNIGVVYIEEGEFDKAIKLYEGCLGMARQLHYLAAVVDVYSNLAALYAKKNDYKSAYNYQEKFMVANDSMINESSTKQIQELETKYQTTKKEKELQKNEIELHKRRNQLFILTLIIIVVVFSALWLSLFYRRKKIIATELEKAKSVFFSNIAHDFRTPVALITGPIEQIIAESGDEQLKKKLAMPLRNAHYLLKLINQLLDVSKLELGIMMLHENYGDLDIFISELTDHMQPMAAEKNISLTYASTLPGFKCKFDANSIEKIMYNLVSNAIKFTPDNGTVAVALTGSAGDPASVMISVKDNGPGISASDQKNIFDRFFRSKETGSAPGVGLGLSVVKELATMNRGSVIVESAPGKGSDFRVVLPYSIATAATGNHGAADPATDEGEIKDKVIAVVIEDNADMLAYISSLLTGIGITVYECANGKDGLEKAQELVPDIVITDIMLPDIDGYEVCAALKQGTITDHIPVIMLTARASAERRIEAIEKGADAYITKPFNAQELTGSIQNLLSLRKKILERYRQPAKSNETIAPDATTTLKASGNKFVVDVMAIIEKNMADETFSVDQLSKEMFLSRAQFHRKLKVLTGFAASDLIRTIRLEKALELLKNNAGNVTEVAFMTGFNSQPYFTKCFTQHFGYTPKEVKK